MAPAKVVALHAFSDDEALGWLSDHADGRIEIALGDLARQFGWPLTRLRQRLAAWTAAGRIVQSAGSRGKVVLAPTRSARETAAELVGRAFAVAPVAANAASLPARPVAAMASAGVLLVTALGLAGVGLVMNARFAATFGQTAEAAALLAAIGLAVDLLAVVLPGVGAELWRRRAIPTAAAAWLLWLMVLAMTWLAATGFASTEIGDAVAGRARLAGDTALLTERIERLRHERAGITELRPVAAVEVALQSAQIEAQPVWAVTDGCRDVTRVSSARICAPVLALRQVLALAVRRDAIDAELVALQAQRAALPVVATADPQAATAAETIAWLSAGALAPSPSDIARLRTLGLALTPSLAGLVAMLALALTRRE